MKSKRFRCAGHVLQMKDIEQARGIFNTERGGK